MSNLDFRVMGFYIKIDRYNKFRTYSFYIGILSAFFNMCILIGAENTTANDTVSQLIDLIIFSVIQVGTLVVDVYYQKKIWLSQYEIFRIETEDLEHKKRVAEIKNEVLPDYLQDKNINLPEALHISITKYVILFVINIVIIILWINKVLLV